MIDNIVVNLTEIEKERENRWKMFTCRNRIINTENKSHAKRAFNSKNLGDYT